MECFKCTSKYANGNMATDAMFLSALFTVAPEIGAVFVWATPPEAHAGARGETSKSSRFSADLCLHATPSLVPAATPRYQTGPDLPANWSCRYCEHLLVHFIITVNIEAKNIAALMFSKQFGMLRLQDTDLISFLLLLLLPVFHQRRPYKLLMAS